MEIANNNLLDLESLSNMSGYDYTYAFPKNVMGNISNATGTTIKPVNPQFHLPDRICGDGSVRKICLGHGGTVAKGW